MDGEKMIDKEINGEEQVEDVKKNSEQQTEEKETSGSEENKSGEEQKQSGEAEEEPDIEKEASKQLEGVEEYLDKLDNKADIELFIQLVDKGLSPDKAYTTLQKVVEKENSKVKENQSQEIVEDKPTSIEGIVDKYI